MTIIVISRITGAFRLLACSLLVCAAVVHGPSTAFAQTVHSFGEHASQAPGVLFVVFGVCLGPKLVLFMRKS